MNRHNFCILWKDIYPIFYRLLPSFSTRDDLRYFFELIFLDDLFHTEIHILLTNHQEDGADERTGLEFIKGMGENGFARKGVELFLLPLYEANAFSSGDDHCVCFHHSMTNKNPSPSPSPLREEGWGEGIG